MPRRTRIRMEKATQPRDLTPPDNGKTLSVSTRGLSPHQSSRDLLRARIERDKEAGERQRQASIQGGIDWSVCLVPGCGQEPPRYLVPTLLESEQHDPNVWLPFCNTHGSTVWRTMNQVWKDPEIQAEMLAADARFNEAVERRTRAVNDAENAGPGHIYMLRQNGLIKVGWSSRLENRLKAYGPNVEILCHYAGSRDDETNLHRQLRPSLAKGREWYHDDKVLDLFIKDAIKRHGPPTHQAYWTRPKPDMIGKRSIR